MKNMKKLLRKAMVWSLAASMLVATPLTASASDLIGIYKIENPKGEVVGNENASRTGTVTSTGTKVLTDESVGKITGIQLSETNVNLSMNDGKKNSETTLTATILYTGDFSESDLESFKRAITWKSGDTQVVALKNLAAESKKADMSQMGLQAKAGGTATVTASLDNYAANVHFTATANVSVKEYAVGLEFSKTVIPEKANAEYSSTRFGYQNHSVDLNAALIKTPATANDEITFEIVAGYNATTGKNATNVATLKNGILTYKKTGWVEIVAVGERVRSEKLRIAIETGTPASKIDIVKTNDENVAKTEKLDVSETDQRALTVKARFYRKENKKQVLFTSRNDCTDSVTWTSNKPAIVKVTGSGDQVTLVPTGVGQAKITAKTSSGKQAAFNVKVSATMTSIKITSDDTTIYGGQTLKLTADRYFGETDKETWKNFPGSGGVTWYLKNNADDKKYASIKKDVFTAKAKVAGAPKDGIEVSVKSAQKYGKPKAAIEATNSIKVKLAQADVRYIKVYEGSEKVAAAGYTKAEKENMTNGSVTINVGNERTLIVQAFGADKVTTTLPDGTPLVKTLNISVNKEKFATAELANGNATITALAKGTPVVTISGTKMTKDNEDETKRTYGAIKATFKAKVMAPTKSLQLTPKVKAIKAAPKNANNQTIKKQAFNVTAKLDKGTSSNAKQIEWTVYIDGTKAATLDAGKNKVGAASDSAIIKRNGATAAITLNEGKFAAGQVVTVVAALKDGTDVKNPVSVSSTVNLPVVTPSKAVAIFDTNVANGIFKNSNNKNNQADLYLTADSNDQNKKTELTLKAMVNTTNKVVTDVDRWKNPGENGLADVTYTVNKKGIVSIVDGTVKGIKPGTVKITATTSDGVKAVLTVKVAE
ncbi:MAG: hypothetical protein NC430_08040 [bacterium]|nr:hypothetical protein [bacterium]